ncbi:MAG: hypothetical protein ABI467_23880 [Kofleriaceae bacterium]
MFESLEKRRRGPSLWKAFGITCTVCTLGVILYVHARDARDAEDAERRHGDLEAAAAQRDQPHRVERGGIRVELPSEPMFQGDYRNGGMEGEGFEVTWNAGAPWSAAESDRHAQDFAAKHLGFSFDHTDVIALGGAPARAYTLGHDAHRIYLAYGSCAGRRVHVLVYDARAAFERMIQTFECLPDKTVDLARRDVVVDAVAGWKRVDPAEVPLALEDAHGVRVTTWLLKRQWGKSIADLVLPAAAGAGLHLREPASTRDDKVFYTGSYDAKSPADLLAFRCPDDDIAIVIVRGPADALNPGVTLADSARCLQAGEVMPVY